MDQRQVVDPVAVVLQGLAEAHRLQLLLASGGGRVPLADGRVGAGRVELAGGRVELEGVHEAPVHCRGAAITDRKGDLKKTIRFLFN